MIGRRGRGMRSRTYRDQNTGAFADVSVEDSSAQVHRLYTPRAARGRGGASAVMASIARDADRHGVTVTLQALTYDEPGALNQGDLEQFYRGRSYQQDDIGMFVRTPQPRGRRAR